MVRCGPGYPLAVGLVSAGEAAPGEPAPLAVDPLVIAWLQGELRLDPVLVGLVQLVEPRQPLDDWPVEAMALMMQRAIERGSACALCWSDLRQAGVVRLLLPLRRALRCRRLLWIPPGSPTPTGPMPSCGRSVWR